VNDEKAWILQAQNGNQDAFAQLVETYQTPVFNLCYRMLGEPEAAEDAAQETFLRAYQHILRYDSKRSFATWLLSIAAHYCIDRLRRRRLVLFSMDQEGDDGQPVELADPEAVQPEKEAVRREERDRLHIVLQSLDSTDRAAIVLRYWYEFSEAEIADTLNLTISAVKSRLHRARRELGRLWQEDSDAQPTAERMPYGSPVF
jgi:RNA polymerase sigma-70 factor (ECF subfamily)